MNRRNNYNQYTHGYTAPIEGSSIVYEPVYDPTTTDRMTELLQQRSNKYDVARQNLSEFQGQVGGMDTYAPDMLNQKLEGFNQRVSDLVKTQYGGDYGLAANDIVGMMAAEKKDPFYKLNAAQVKAGDEMRAARAKDPGKFYEFDNAKPITSEAYLKEAYANNNLAAFDEKRYDYIPDTYTLAERQLKNVEANASTNLFNDLNKAEKAELAKHGITSTSGLLKATSNVGINPERLKELADSMAESMLNQDQYFVNRYGSATNEDGTINKQSKAFKEAKNVVTDASPQFVFNKSQSNLMDMRAKENSQNGGDDENPYPTTVPSPELPVNNKNLETISIKKYGTGVGQINLDGVSKFKKKITKTEPGFPSKTTFSEEIVNEENPEGKDVELLKIAAYEIRYGADVFKGITNNNDKHRIMSNLEDTKNYTFSQNIKITDTNAIDKLAGLNNNRKNTSGPIMVLQDNRWVQEGKYGDGNEEITFDGWDTNRPLSEFIPGQIDPKTGRMIAFGPNGSVVAYYPSNEAAELGKKLKSVNDAISVNGYATISGITDKSGLPTGDASKTPIVIEHYDPGTEENKFEDKKIMRSVVLVTVDEFNDLKSGKISNNNMVKGRARYPYSDVLENGMYHNKGKLSFTPRDWKE